MKKTVLTYGGIIGVILALFIVIPFAYYDDPSDMAGNETIGFAVMFIAFAGMFFAIRSFRDKQNEGTIGFGKALAIGLLISLFASVIYSLSWTILTEVSDMDFMEMYSEMQVNKMQEEGASEDEIAAEMEGMETFFWIYKNPVTIFLFTILEPLPVAVIVSLFCALMLKRKPQIAEAKS